MYNNFRTSLFLLNNYHFNQDADGFLNDDKLNNGMQERPYQLILLILHYLGHISTQYLDSLPLQTIFRIIFQLRTKMFGQKLLRASSTFFKLAYTMSTKHKRDLYQVLGVGKDASQSDIKKAYYKLAQELHPDKNSSPNAKDKFAEANNAYEVLSNAQKRKNYDQTGSAEQNPFQGANQEDIFNHFRNGGANSRRGANVNMNDFQSIFQDLFGGGGNRRSRGRGGHSEFAEDINIKIDLQFSESVNGVTKIVEISKRCNCSVCKGTKAKPGSKPQKCQTCQGTGFMTFHQGVMIMRAECHACGGSGQTISSPCTQCSGQGVQMIKAKEEITFPRGIDNGATLRFKGKGHLEADLIVKVAVRKHPLFRRQGNDSLIQKVVSVLDAILGTEINVETIYGETKKVKIPAGTQNGDKIKLAKEGFYRINSTDKGSQIITVKITIPEKLSQAQKSLYQKLKEISK